MNWRRRKPPLQHSPSNNSSNPSHTPPTKQYAYVTQPTQTEKVIPLSTAPFADNGQTTEDCAIRQALRPWIGPETETQAQGLVAVPTQVPRQRRRRLWWFPLPPSSDTSGTNADPARVPIPAVTASGPLYVTSLSVTSWRPQYPRLGQFASTESEEVVATTPNGLIYFRRVQDHPSRPWSKPQPFPPTTARLDASTVTGLALQRGEKGTLHVYCIAADKLHAFSFPVDRCSAFVDPCPPFSLCTRAVSGTPAATSIYERSDLGKLCDIAPCRSGGMLYTSTIRYQDSHYGPPKQGWEPANQVAAHLGIISAVSVAATHSDKTGSSSMFSDRNTDIVAVCIANSRLHSIEGPFEERSYHRKNTWQGPKSIRIEHPGEVTGNPVLLSSRIDTGRVYYQLDLLVPSAEGGVFHFMRTVSTPDQWHMIGRISFPTGVPIASSLACARLPDRYSERYNLHAFVQCGGRLYLVKTNEGAYPWAGSQLYPIEGPGPFLH